MHALLEEDLVDVLRLMVFPVAIGSGLRVFPETERRLTMSYAGTESFPWGVVVHTYERIT